MEITRKELEDLYLKKSGFESFKADLADEIQNLKQSSKRRDLRLEKFIKEIDEDLTILRLESNEGRDQLKQELSALKTEMNFKFNTVIKTVSDEIQNLKSDLFRFKDSFETMKMLLIFILLLHFFTVYSSLGLREKYFS